MDGVFFAATSAKLKESKLRFDPQFSFHFYDMDFCRSAESLGVKMGTIPLSLIHESYGSMDNQWYDAYRAYLQKWGG
jgi:GT2 family glycosyltransferase